MTPTEEQIAEIRARVEGATPGPWRVGYKDKNGQSVVCDEHIERFTCWHHSVGAIEKEMEHNADFIAHAREDIPALLSHIEEMEKRFATQEKSAIHVRKEFLKAQDDRNSAQRELAALKAEVERLREEIEVLSLRPQNWDGDY